MFRVVRLLAVVYYLLYLYHHCMVSELLIYHISLLITFFVYGKIPSLYMFSAELRLVYCLCLCVLCVVLFVLYV